MTNTETNNELERLTSYWRDLVVSWDGGFSWTIEGPERSIAAMRKTLKRCAPSNLAVQDPTFASPDRKISARTF